MEGMVDYLCEECDKFERELERDLKKEVPLFPIFDFEPYNEACVKKGDSRIDLLINKVMHLIYYSADYSPLIGIHSTDLDYLYEATEVYDYEFATDCNFEKTGIAPSIKELEKVRGILAMCNRFTVLYLVPSSRTKLEDLVNVQNYIFGFLKDKRSWDFGVYKNNTEDFRGLGVILIASY